MFCSTVRVGNREVHGSPVGKVFKVIGFVILGIIGITALAVIFGLIVMWLWNALMPDIFNLPEIGYWQAVGLVVLSHIFFGHDHKSSVNNRKDKNKSKNRAKLHIAAAGSSLEIDKDLDGEKEDIHVNTDNNCKENQYDTFREFWNGYGRDAFDKWLNRNQKSENPPE